MSGLLDQTPPHARRYRRALVLTSLHSSGVCVLFLPLSSPTIIQVCCNTWNSSLNRAELEDHLLLANTKGGMVFQAPEAEPARVFLHTILQGRALEASCSLRQLPKMTPVGGEQASAAAAAVTGAGAAAAAAVLGVDSSAVEFSALPASSLSLHTLPDAEKLFTTALAGVAPLWFHPQADAEDQGQPRAPQLTQTIPLGSDSANVSAALLPSLLGAAAAAQMPDEPVAAAASAAAIAAAAASSMGLQRSHFMPFSMLSVATPFGNVGPSHITQPLTLSASDLLAHNRRHPFKSRSTKLKEAYERAPLQLDLLPFVQISSEPIKLTGHIPAISVPSVVIYNQPRVALSSKPSLRKAARTTTYESDDSERAAAVATETAAASAAGAAAPQQESLLLDLLGAATSVKREPDPCGESDADRDRRDGEQLEARRAPLEQPSPSAAPSDTAASAGHSALDALASVADPVSAVAELKQEATTISADPQPAIESKAAESSAAPSPAVLAAAPGTVPAVHDAAASLSAPIAASCAPCPSASSDRVLIAVTREELFQFEMFKAEQLAAAAGTSSAAVAAAAAAAAAAVGTSYASPWSINAAPSPQLYTLPITARSGHLRSVRFDGSLLPTTGILSCSLLGGTAVPSSSVQHCPRRTAAVEVQQ